MRRRHFLTASHAALLVDRAGKPYRPSNGTEGDYFEAAWCSDCAKQVEDACPIFMAMLFYRADEPEYPSEVKYGSDGHPVCLGHVQLESA